MNFEVSIDGMERLEGAFLELSERITDWREAWPGVNEGFENIERDLFASGGASGQHGKWAELSAAYEERRARYFQQPFPFPLRRTLALEHSLTQRGADGAVVEMRPTEFVRGSSLPYARAHMERRGNRPERRPIDPTDEQIKTEIFKPLKDEARRIARREGFIVGGDE